MISRTILLLISNRSRIRLIVFSRHYSTNQRLCQRLHDPDLFARRRSSLLGTARQNLRKSTQLSLQQVVILCTVIWPGWIRPARRVASERWWFPLVLNMRDHHFNVTCRTCLFKYSSACGINCSGWFRQESGHQLRCAAAGWSPSQSAFRHRSCRCSVASNIICWLECVRRNVTTSRCHCVHDAAAAPLNTSYTSAVMQSIVHHSVCAVRPSCSLDPHVLLMLHRHRQADHSERPVGWSQRWRDSPTDQGSSIRTGALFTTDSNQPIHSMETSSVKWCWEWNWIIWASLPPLSSTSSLTTAAKEWLRMTVISRHLISSSLNLPFTSLQYLSDVNIMEYNMTWIRCDVATPNNLFSTPLLNSPPSSPLLSFPLLYFSFLSRHQKYGDVCPANWQPGDSTVSSDTAKSKEYFRGASLVLDRMWCACACWNYVWCLMDNCSMIPFDVVWCDVM